MGKKLIKVMIFGIIVFILVWIIFLIGNPKGPVLYNKPIMIMNKESNEIPIQIYNYKNKFLILSEYETILSYSKEDKILGTNKYKEISNLDGKQYSLQRLNNLILLETKQIDMTRGFFFKETDFKKQEDKGSIKRIYWYNQEKDPSKIGYIFTIPKNKPYFKVQLFAETKNNNLLTSIGYGLIINYSIYLPNGTILKNDYEKLSVDKLKPIILDGKEQDPNNPLFRNLPKETITELRGTNYKTIPTKPYQIFYDDQNAIIIFANKIDYIDNLFQWRVFRIFISQKENENTFVPLYIAILNDAKLEWKGNTWIITSKEFNGDVETLIKDWKF